MEKKKTEKNDVKMMKNFNPMNRGIMKENVINPFVLKENVGNDLVLNENEGGREEKVLTMRRRRKRTVRSKQEVVVDITKVRQICLKDSEDLGDLKEIMSEKETNMIHLEEIDTLDGDNPRLVSHLVANIYKYLREKENDNQITCYMNNQTEVNEIIRTILVDWLVEVHQLFKLIPETLYLTIDILDRYLQVKNIERKRFHLLGITAMLVASKYEEIYSPEVNDFVYISDETYTAEDILNMEQDILRIIDFNLTYPSSLYFLRRYTKAAESNIFIHTLCKYLIEMSLMTSKMLIYTPSLIASSSVYLARKMLSQKPHWPNTLEYYTSYTEEKLQNCVLDLQNLVFSISCSNYQSIVSKYSSAKLGEVSLLNPYEEIESDEDDYEVN